MNYSMNVDDYISVYPDFLDIETCDKTTGLLNALDDWHVHSYADHLSEELVSFDDDLYICYMDSPLKQKIQDKLWFAIEDYINYFDFEWYNSWAGYTEIRFNKYPEGSRMRVHCDHIHTLFDGSVRGIPTLTMLGALNNKYEGGELYICNQKIELKAGSLVIFPSNFMFPHEVKEVTSGTRFSYVSWVY